MRARIRNCFPMAVMSNVLGSLLLACILIILSSRADAGETVIYYHNDALGSPVATTDAQGNLLWREEYQPYGERLLKQGNGQNNLWYTGKPEEQALGINYFGARWYDPTIGRFMAVDAAGFREEDLNSFNVYAYANNNPYRFVDPDGNAAEEVALVVYATSAAVWASGVGATAVSLYYTGAAAVASVLGFEIVAGSLYAKAATTEVAIAASGLGKPSVKQIVQAGDKVKDATQRIGRALGRTIDKATGEEVGRFVVDPRGNTMIEPVGGRTIPAGKGGVDTHTLYPNNSNYQRLNPQGHGNNSTPHGHGHLPGTGPGMKGQGPSIDPQGNVVPWNSSDAHWPTR
jgi:RHS repeat-associated protein